MQFPWRLGLEIYCYKEKTEVDFVFKKGTRLSLVQVTWDLNDLSTYQRKVESLQAARRGLSCETAILIVAEPLLANSSPQEGITFIQAYTYLMLDPEAQKQLLFPS